MKQRIEKLAKKAGFSVYGEIYSPNDEDSPITKNIEKFAELIIKECAHFVGGYTKENEFGTDVKEAYEEITKHFGIEQ